MIRQQLERPQVQKVFQVTGVAAERGMEALGDLVARAKDRWQQHRERKAVLDAVAPRETVVVYDEMHSSIWRANVPVDELVEHLDMRCRYLPDRDTTFYWSIGLGSLSVGCLLWLFFLPFLHPFLAAFFGVPLGALIGAGGGYLVAPRFRPKAIWMVRRFVEVETDEGTGEEREIPTLEPVIHSHLDFETRYNLAKAQREEQLEKNGGSEEEDPDVHLNIVRATGVYEMMQARDGKTILASSGDKWSKFTLMGVGWIAICFFGLLILFAIAMTE